MFATHDVGTASLNNSNIVTVLIVILSNIVARIATTDNYSFLALDVRPGTLVFRRMAQHVPLEIVDSLHSIRELFFAGVTCRLNNKTWVKRAFQLFSITLVLKLSTLTSFSLSVYRSFELESPLFLGVIVLCLANVNFVPDIEF